MNWGGHQKGDGIEYFIYAIYAIAVAAAVTIAGAGIYSIDAALAERAARS